MNKWVVVGLGLLVVSFSVLVFRNGKNTAPVLDSSTGNTTISEQTIPQEPVVVDDQSSAYREYSPAAFASTVDKKRVLFFHASWCPTCKVAHAEFEKGSPSIPEGVLIFKTDYDAEDDLKKTYGVTYQHTFVQVDEQGNVVTKWNGGGITELAANVK